MRTERCLSHCLVINYKVLRDSGMIVYYSWIFVSRAGTRLVQKVF